METVRLGVIGLHNHYHAYPIGEYLKRGIPNAKLVAVADEREKYARGFAETYGADAYYTDYRKLLERKDIDAVLITSYTSAHAEHVEACAETGRHILLDKPIATTMHDAHRIVRAVEKHKVKLMMAYLLHFIPAYAKAKEYIDQGAIGKPVSVFYSIRVPVSFIREAPDATTQGWYIDPVRNGGGGFIDHAVHFTDFFRWILNSEAVNVLGRIAKLTYTDLPVEDYGIAVITFASGAIATVESTWHAADWYGPMSSPDRCTLTGTEGEIEFHYQKSPQLEVEGKRLEGGKRLYFDWKGEERYETAYRDITVEFARCILEDRAPKPNAVDGLKALEMTLAAYLAHDRNCAVALPLPEGGHDG